MLTDEEVIDLWNEHMVWGDPKRGGFDDFLSAVRAAVAAERKRCAGGHDLEAMCEAFNRLIEAHANLRSPFHQPVCADAQMALRVLRGIVAALRAERSS